MRTDARVDIWEYFRRLSHMQVERIEWLSLDVGDYGYVIKATAKFRPNSMDLIDSESKRNYGRDSFSLDGEEVSRRHRESVECVFIKKTLLGSGVTVRSWYGT